MRAFGQTSESAGDRRRAEAKLGERGGDVAVQFVVVEATAHRAVQGAVEFAAQGIHPATYRHRDLIDGVPEMGADAQGQVATQGLQRLAKYPVGDAQKRRGVGARLHDDQVRFANQQQNPVGLNGIGEVNLFTLAVGKVRLAESGIGGGRQRLFSRPLNSCDRRAGRPATPSCAVLFALTKARRHEAFRGIFQAV